MPPSGNAKRVAHHLLRPWNPQLGRAFDTDTALGAQTAWLQANSEFIDAGIDLQMNNAELLKAEGSYTSDRQNNKE